MAAVIAFAADNADRYHHGAPLDRVVCPTCRTLLDPDRLALARHLAGCEKAPAELRALAAAQAEQLAPAGPQDLTGQTFGYLFVLGEQPGGQRTAGRCGQTYVIRKWRARCDYPMEKREACGRIEVMGTAPLLLGEYRACARCRHRLRLQAILDAQEADRG